MKLKIAENLSLPAQETVTNTIVVYGGKGMGKTNFGAVLCEELATAGKRFCFVDPVGVAWGLRHSANGSGPGLDILILGGRHGDVPIEPGGGTVVADFVADAKENVLIDISSRADGTRWSINEKIRFVTAYVTRLLERHRRDAPPLMLIIDEAARFAPQQVAKGTAGADCLAALEVLVEEGRNSGIGITLLTQRSARMAKSVSELAEAMIAFRIIGPNSVDAVLDWFGEHVHKSKWNELVDELRKLPRGTALVVSPGWLNFEGTAQIRLRRTFDSSKTPTGTERRLAKQVKPADLEQLRARIAETVEKAEAADPSKMRAKIAGLEKRAADAERKVADALAQLEAKKARPAEAAAASPKIAELRQELARHRRALEAAMKILVKVRAVDFPVETEDDRKALEHAVAAAVRQITGPIEKRVTALASRVEGIRKAAGDAEKAIAALLDEKIDLAVQVERREPFAVAAERTRPERPPRPATTNGDGTVSGVGQRILNALAELEQLGARQPERELVALLAGYTHLQSKGFVNAMSALSSGGFIAYPSGGTVAMTDAGRAQAEPPDAPRSAREVQDRICQLLGGASSKILKPLIDAYPSPMAREAVAAAAGYGHLQSKGFVNAMSRLRTLGFIDYPDRGSAVAMPVLFLEGR